MIGIVADDLNSNTMIDAVSAPSLTYFSMSLTLAFAVTLMSSMLLKFWLSTRQMRHVALHRSAVPAVFANRITLAAHQKAADYTLAQGKLGMLELAWGTAWTLGWTLMGGLSWLNQALLQWMPAGIAQQVALLAAFAVMGSIIDIPLAVYRTFVLEQRFGFNKTSLSLWLKDLGKSAVLSLSVGLPIAALVLWVMGTTGPLWWLWTWAVWMAFNLLVLLVYPAWIAPWFNKFQPLEDPELKDRVTKLMARCGFTSKGFYVMDGSRRSAHANAYFTCFGASKRVVFYDTLLAQLSAAEVDAVLAHELGHFKHKHIVKRIVSTFALSLAGFAGLGWVSQQVWFYTGLGVTPNMTGPNDALDAF